MLPRQLVNHKKYVNEGAEGREGTMPLNHRENNNQHSSNFNQSFKNQYKSTHEEPPLFTKNPKYSYLNPAQQIPQHLGSSPRQRQPQPQPYCQPPNPYPYPSRTPLIQQ